MVRNPFLLCGGEGDGGTGYRNHTAMPSVASASHVIVIRVGRYPFARLKQLRGGGDQAGVGPRHRCPRFLNGGSVDLCWLAWLAVWLFGTNA